MGLSHRRPLPPVQLPKVSSAFCPQLEAEPHRRAGLGPSQGSVSRAPREAAGRRWSSGRTPRGRPLHAGTGATGLGGTRGVRAGRCVRTCVCARAHERICTRGPGASREGPPGAPFLGPHPHCGGSRTLLGVTPRPPEHSTASTHLALSLRLSRSSELQRCNPFDPRDSRVR